MLWNDVKLFFYSKNRNSGYVLSTHSKPPGGRAFRRRTAGYKMPENVKI